MMVDNPYEVEREDMYLEEVAYPMNTYISLDKDIKLVLKENNTYDRVIHNGDWWTVENLDSLENGILFKLITMQNELGMHKIYKNWGNPALNQLKHNVSELLRVEIEEGIRKCIEEISRVRSVDNLKCYFYPPKINGDGATLVVDIDYTSTSDQMGKITTTLTSL